jgi:hypothetical protein
MGNLFGKKKNSFSKVWLRKAGPVIALLCQLNPARLPIPSISTSANASFMKPIESCGMVFHDLIWIRHSAIIVYL